MKLMTSIPTINTKKILNIIYTCVTIGLTTKLGMLAYTKHTQNELVRKSTICPALLSIGRSARDSLIIMRAEPLCSQYVLETLK